MRKALERVYKLNKTKMTFSVEQSVLNIDLGYEDPYEEARKILGKDKLYSDDLNGYSAGPYIGVKPWDAWMGDTETLILVSVDANQVVLKSMVGEEEANHEINYFYFKGERYTRVK